MGWSRCGKHNFLSCDKCDACPECDGVEVYAAKDANGTLYLFCESCKQSLELFDKFHFVKVRPTSNVEMLHDAFSSINIIDTTQMDLPFALQVKN